MHACMSVRNTYIYVLVPLLEFHQTFKYVCYELNYDGDFVWNLAVALFPRTHKTTQSHMHGKKGSFCAFHLKYIGVFVFLPQGNCKKKYLLCFRLGVGYDRRGLLCVRNERVQCSGCRHNKRRAVVGGPGGAELQIDAIKVPRDSHVTNNPDPESSYRNSTSLDPS